MSSLKFVRYPIWFALSLSFAILTGMLVMVGEVVTTSAAFTTAVISLGQLVIGIEAFVRSAEDRAARVRA